MMTTNAKKTGMDLYRATIEAEKLGGEIYYVSISQFILGCCYTAGAAHRRAMSTVANRLLLERKLEKTKVEGTTPKGAKWSAQAFPLSILADSWAEVSGVKEVSPVEDLPN